MVSSATFAAHCTAHSISCCDVIITLSSSARPHACSRGGWFTLGERHTQSNSPLKGCEPDVSRNIFSEWAWRADVRASRGYLRGSPPVITIACAAHDVARSTISLIDTGGYSLGFHVALASHHLQPTSHPPRRMK